MLREGYREPWPFQSSQPVPTSVKADTQRDGEGWSLKTTVGQVHLLLPSLPSGASQDPGVTLPSQTAWLGMKGQPGTRLCTATVQAEAGEGSVGGQERRAQHCRAARECVSPPPCPLPRGECLEAGTPFPFPAPPSAWCE